MPISRHLFDQQESSTRLADEQLLVGLDECADVLDRLLELLRLFLLLVLVACARAVAALRALVFLLLFFWGGFLFFLLVQPLFCGLALLVFAFSGWLLFLLLFAFCICLDGLFLGLLIVFRLFLRLLFGSFTVFLRLFGWLLLCGFLSRSFFLLFFVFVLEEIRCAQRSSLFY